MYLLSRLWDGSFNSFFFLITRRYLWIIGEKINLQIIFVFHVTYCMTFRDIMCWKWWVNWNTCISIFFYLFLKSNHFFNTQNFRVNAKIVHVLKLKRELLTKHKSILNDICFETVYTNKVMQGNSKIESNHGRHQHLIDDLRVFKNKNIELNTMH